MKNTFNCLAKYSHLRAAFGIFISSLVVLLLSFCIEDKNAVSILQNVFAGLITGLVITLIGSLKEKENNELETETQILDEMSRRLKSFYDAYGTYSLNRLDSSEHYRDAAFDLVNVLESVDKYMEEIRSNTDVNMMLKDKASCLFVSDEKYDRAEMLAIYKKMEDIIVKNKGYGDSVRFEFDDLVSQIRKIHLVIRENVDQKQINLNKRKFELMRSII